MIKKFAEPLVAQPRYIGDSCEITAKTARMEDFEPKNGRRYDLIIFRYCLGYLSDNKEAALVLNRYARMLAAPTNDS